MGQTIQSCTKLNLFIGLAITLLNLSLIVSVCGELNGDPIYVGAPGRSTVNQQRSIYTGILTPNHRAWSQPSDRYGMAYDPTSIDDIRVKVHQTLSGNLGVIWTVPNSDTDATTDVYQTITYTNYYSHGAGLCYDNAGNSYLVINKEVIRQDADLKRTNNDTWYKVGTTTTSIDVQQCTMHPNGIGMYFGEGDTAGSTGGVWFYDGLGTAANPTTLVQILQGKNRISDMTTGPDNTIIFSNYNDGIYQFPANMSGLHSFNDVSSTTQQILWDGRHWGTPMLAFQTTTFAGVDYDTAREYLYVSTRKRAVYEWVDHHFTWYQNEPEYYDTDFLGSQVLRFGYNSTSKSYNFDQPLVIAENFGYSDKLVVEQNTGAIYFYTGQNDSPGKELVRGCIFLRWINVPAIIMSVQYSYYVAPSIGALPEGANMTDTVTWSLSDGGMNGTFLPDHLTWVVGEPATIKSFQYQPNDTVPIGTTIPFQFVPVYVAPNSSTTNYAASDYPLPVQRGIIIHYNQNGVYSLQTGDIICGAIELLPPLDSAQSLTIELQHGHKYTRAYAATYDSLNADLTFSSATSLSYLNFSAVWASASSSDQVVSQQFALYPKSGTGGTVAMYKVYDQIPMIFDQSSRSFITKCGVTYVPPPPSLSSSTATHGPTTTVSSSSSSSTGASGSVETGAGSQLSHSHFNQMVIIQLVLIVLTLIGMHQ